MHNGAEFTFISLTQKIGNNNWLARILYDSHTYTHTYYKLAFIAYTVYGRHMPFIGTKIAYCLHMDYI